jgi:hypothetical protein
MSVHRAALCETRIIIPVRNSGERDGIKVTAATVLDETTGLTQRVPCEYFISTMPVRDLVAFLEPHVRIGRLRIFNNWSPPLVADPGTIWLGLEYLCSEGDDLWAMDNARFIDYAAGELEKIGLIDRKDVIDGTLVRVPKAYPAYFWDVQPIRAGTNFLGSISESLSRRQERHA